MIRVSIYLSVYLALHSILSSYVFLARAQFRSGSGQILTGSTGFGQVQEKMILSLDVGFL